MNLGELIIPESTLHDMIDNPNAYPVEYLEEAIRRAIRGDYGEDIRTAMLVYAAMFGVHDTLGVSLAELSRLR